MNNQYIVNNAPIFVRLTDANLGVHIWVNLNHIVSMVPDEDGTETAILVTGDRVSAVTESPEVIFNRVNRIATAFSEWVGNR